MSTSQPPPSESPATLAPLWRVLEHAKASRQAAVDALVALSLRQVSLPTQKDSASSIYFVTDAQVGRLLPLFTSLALMETAAMINRWTLGRTPLVLNAKEAMRIAESHGCDGIVVDMGAPHALELQHIEYQPFLVLPESKQTSGGPYEAVGRVSYSLLRAVRSVPAPADSKRAPASPAISEAPTTSFHPEPSATPSTEVHVDLRGWTFHYLEPLPGPELTAQASRELQSFAEVEWACFVSGAASQTPEHFRPLLALKLDPRMAHRIHDIASHLNKKMGPLTWELALLSAPDIIARIRPHAFSFYP